MSLLRTKQLIAGFAALTAALAAAPAAAHAAPSRGSLAAVTENSSESGRPTAVPVRAGQVSRAAIGVRNTGSAALTGLVVEIHLNDDHLTFSRLYENCWYALDAQPDTAWCEFADEIVAKSVLQLKGPVYGVTAGTAAGARITDSTFSWWTRASVDADGGIEALAKKAAAEGTTAVRGDQGTLALEPGSPRLQEGPGGGGTAFAPTTVLAATTPAADPPAIPPSGPDTARLAAVEEASDNIFQGPLHRIWPNAVLPGTLGVRNLGDTTVDGLVLELRLSDTALTFAEQHSNCWYAVADKPGSAWCEFDAPLAAGATLKVDGPVAKAAQQNRADVVKDVRFHWVSKAWASSHGGIEELAHGDATPGTEAVRGTGDPLTLAGAPANLVGHLRGATDFDMALWPPGATEPTTSPTPAPTTSSPSPAPTSTSTTPAGEDDGGTGGEDDGGTGGEGGGGTLPITGSPVTLVAGIGAALLIAGLLGFVVARRRGTRFQA